MRPRKVARDRGPAGANHRTDRDRTSRILRIVGALLLVAVIIAFLVSFLAGIGDRPSPPRVIGDAERGGAELDRIGARVRVEVLNAAGVAGLARRATQHLRDRGFDVVYIGNAGSFEEDSTVVIARTADVSAAHEVARALGIDSVVVDPDPQLFLDATVRLGRNWPRRESVAPDSTVRGRLRNWLE